MGSRLHERVQKGMTEASQRLRNVAEAKEVLEKLSTLTGDERKRMRSEVRRQYVNHRPRNSQELHDKVRATYGYSIPYTATSPETNAPFEWFCAVYYGYPEDTVALAARGGSKTLQASILNDELCGGNPDFESLHAGGTREQAKVASKYLQKFYKIPELTPGFQEKPATYSAHWKNGSLWEIVTGTMKGVSGQHPVLLTLDEIEFWDKEAINQTWEVPSTKLMDGGGKYKRRWSGFSTRQRGYGAMNWLVDQVLNRKLQSKVGFYQWTTFEMMQPCRTCVALDAHPYGNDEARADVCVLWKYCRGERAKKATGWLSLQEAQDKCIRLGGPDGREWLTQGLCMRPSSHGLVLHNFEKARWPEGNYTDFEYTPDLDWYAVHDPAEGKKSVILFFQIWQDKIYVFDEIVDPLCAHTMEAKQAFFEHCTANRTKRGLAPLPDPACVIVDPHRTDAMADWRYGSASGAGTMHKYRTDAPDLSKYSGTGQELKFTIEFLRQHICDGSRRRKVYVNKDYCPYLDRSIGEYHYPTDDTTNEITSDNPVADQYEDEIDTLRYLVMWYCSKFVKGRVGDISMH